MQRLKLEATLNVHDGCVSDLYDSLLSYWFVSLCDTLFMFVGGWLGVYWFILSRIYGHYFMWLDWVIFSPLNV